MNTQQNDPSTATDAVIAKGQKKLPVRITVKPATAGASIPATLPQLAWALARTLLNYN